MRSWSTNRVAELENTKELDMDFVRGQFPGLANGWTFFDNAGGTQILARAVDRINDFLFNTNVQTGGSYELSLRAAAALQAGREAMMHFVNADRPEEIAFAASTTVALQNLARSMASQFQPGDEIVITVSDHESNIGPWVGLVDIGVKIRTWNLDKDTLELNLDDLAPLMTDKTRLVAVTHVSNILGTINPVGEIAKFVHDRGALICVDSVAYAPHRAIDVAGLGYRFPCVKSLQGIRAAFRSVIRKIRSVREPRQSVSLFLWQGQSAGQTRTRERKL